MSLRRPGVMDGYIARRVLVATLATWAVLLSFDLLTALVNELDDIGEGAYTLSHAVLYVVYTAPRRAYDNFPTVALIGIVLGLGGLSGRSELTAMRAVGVSRLRIGLSALLSLGVLTGLMVVNAELVAPPSEQSAAAVENSAKARDVIVARFSGLWAREGNVFMNARSGASRQDESGSWTELQGVRLFEFDDEGRLLSLAEARTAEHRRDGWTLRDVRRSVFEGRSVRIEKLPEERWTSGLDDQALSAAAARPRYLSSRELRRNMDYLERNGLSSRAFSNAYWARWFYPVNVLALCLAALPFAFGSLRSGGFGKRLFVGIVLGIGFLLAQRLFVNLADVYNFDARIAFALPPIGVLALAWLGFGRRLG